jgi:hypothetical protein
MSTRNGTCQLTDIVSRSWSGAPGSVHLISDVHEVGVGELTDGPATVLIPER